MSPQDAYDYLALILSRQDRQYSTQWGGWTWSDRNAVLALMAFYKDTVAHCNLKETDETQEDILCIQP